MLNNYLIIAYRNLIRHKLFSLINIFGLMLGMAAFLLILLYVSVELSYDTFHEQGKEIYRIKLDSYRNGVFDVSTAATYYGGGPAIKEAFAEVTDFVRLHRADGMISYQDANGQINSYQENNAFYADSSFFTIFSFPLLKGSASSVLRKPNSMLISESAARKYFGNKQPIGQILTLTGWESGEYVVEGIFKDIPANSHLQFDFLFSIQNLLTNDQFKYGAWYWGNFYTYLLLKPSTDWKKFEPKLPGIIEQHLGKKLEKSGMQEKLLLQPLEDIHLHSGSISGTEAKGNYRTLQILLLIAFFIISIGWLNYINLSTAKRLERAKEVGIRKVLGSGQWQLIKQFLTESLLLNCIALLGAIFLVVLALPFFNQLLGHPLSFQLKAGLSFWCSFLAIVVIGIVLSGFYPAFFLSSFEPIKVLKGKLPLQVGGQPLRKALIVCQFAISLLLTIATLTIGRQIEFMQNRDLGISIEQKVVIQTPKVNKGESFTNSIKYFKEQLAKIAAVKDVTILSEIPGKPIFWANEFKRKNDAADHFKIYSILAIDQDFVPSFNIPLLAGRNFSADVQTDHQGVLINESALRAFGFSNPSNAIGEEIVMDQSYKKIIGVIKDFHHQSFQKSIEPIIFYYIPWTDGYFTLTVEGSNAREILASIQDTYKQVFPSNAFEYFFLDEYFNRQYQAEEQFSSIFTLFSGMAIFIACLGLLGLASYMATCRTKEIGVRKVLGASRLSILLLLNKDIIQPILVANLIAWPVALWGTHLWLEHYAYRVEISVWPFVVSSFIGSMVAVFTLTLQTWQTAQTNPIELLRNE